jgi:2,4-dienoyl-CoA reductase-like NADH-dependent reductase (Old Yellow Enzyme family)
MSSLFEPLTLRGLTLPNRAWVSPMCQYTSVDGLANSWHLVHLGSFAIGRAGLILTEATAVTPEGRISPQDLGLWSDAHAEALAPVVEFAHGQGVAIGIQLAHAGRKASTFAPWRGHDSVPLDQGGWPTLAPSDTAFGRYAAPLAMTHEDLARTRDAFVDAALRALALGVDTVELHFAHGYLMHEFLSPLSNLRDDDYGGSLTNRMRYPLEVVDAVRAAWPDDRPLLMRVSATDWVDGGWDVDSTIELVREAAARGVDLVDVSSAGNDPRQEITIGPGYQVPFAARVRAETGVPTAAVGLITEPTQADDLIADGSADAVFLAREMLRDPHWPLRAARELGADITWPEQYQRAAPA